MGRQNERGYAGVVAQSTGIATKRQFGLDAPMVALYLS
jgi:hypothetical protein